MDTSDRAIGSDAALEPASPCIGICDMDKQRGWCRGCFRTLFEITDWRVLTAANKHAVLARCAERRIASGGGKPRPSAERAAAWAARWSVSADEP